MIIADTMNMTSWLLAEMRNNLRATFFGLPLQSAAPASIGIMNPKNIKIASFIEPTVPIEEQR